MTPAQQLTAALNRWNQADAELAAAATLFVAKTQKGQHTGKPHDAWERLQTHLRIDRYLTPATIIDACRGS